MGVEREKDGVCAGVCCCPLARGVDQASAKLNCCTASVLGVLKLPSGKVTDFGVDEGLGRCQSVDLVKQLLS